MTKKTLGIFILFILLFPKAYATPYFIEKAPHKGEGIYAFLKRYMLESNSCNLSKFLSLNNLKKNTALLQGKKYKLPIYIYRYNGKTIRSTINDGNYKNALDIKHYNEKILKKKLRQTHYISSKILWVPYSNIHCRGKTKHVNAKHNKTKKKTVPLFGKKYKTFKTIDNHLKNRVYYIVSGHGGPDPGARYIGKSKTLCEDEYAYDVSLRLARNLMKQGAIVHIIVQDKNDGIRDAKYLACDKDERSINNKILPLNQRARLKQRVDDVNKLYRKHQNKGVKSQIMVSTHIDSRSYEKSKDVFFYYSPKSKDGRYVALMVHKRLKKEYQQHQSERGYHGTVSARELYVLENAQPASVFIELGNIRNAYDQKRIILGANRQALADWISAGLKDIVK